MKSLLVKLGVILIIGFALFGYADVWGADWKIYSATEMEWCFFDASSITHPSKNIVRVWVKAKFKEKGVLDMVEKYGKKYENLNHLINLSEINCEEKTMHNLSWTYYDNKEGVIYSRSDPSPKWDFIPPESMGEALYKEVCK